MAAPFLLLDRCFGNRFLNRVGHKALFAAVMLACLLACLAGTVQSPSSDPPPAASRSLREWPRDAHGAPMRPLALSAVEQRFAERFPGSIGRFTDGRQALVLREVDTPTRMLHPAADCYRAIGYRIADAQLWRDPEDRLWRCFVTAGPDGRKLRVCERIVDAGGVAFTDTSAWYWAAAAGRSRGPWQAVTLATPIE